jgi:hypothetical protein
MRQTMLIKFGPASGIDGYMWHPPIKAASHRCSVIESTELRFAKDDLLLSLRLNDLQ